MLEFYNCRNFTMQSLSGKFALSYKKLLLYLIPAVGLGIIFLLLWDGLPVNRIFAGGQVIFFCYILFNRISLLKEVSYDSENLYVIENNQQEIIPLEAISTVELKSIGGQWDLNFKPGYTNRNKLAFLPSLIYPFNYKKTEKMVNAFRKEISIAKQRAGKTENIINGICSSNS